MKDADELGREIEAERDKVTRALHRIARDDARARAREDDRRWLVELGLGLLILRGRQAGMQMTEMTAEMAAGAAGAFDTRSSHSSSMARQEVIDQREPESRTWTRQRSYELAKRAEHHRRHVEDDRLLTPERDAEKVDALIRKAIEPRSRRGGDDA